MTVFTLEALQADHGDALLLHFGDGAAVRTVVVDGGPPENDALAQRLAVLQQARTGHAPLPIPLVAVSHLHDDHIGGVLAYVRTLAGENDPVRIECMWLNTFQDLLAESDDNLVAAAVARLPDRERYATASARADAESFLFDGEQRLVAASVDQGRDLRQWADSLRIEINCGFDDVVMAPPRGGTVCEVDGLRITVVWPDEERVNRLRDEWQRERARLEAGVVSTATLERIAVYDDNSLENLGSIVFVAEYAGSRMLLTGDARGDHILEGLRRAELLQGRTLELAVLKLQHHGSIRNFEPSFFAALRARHYLISANGKYGNPETETLEMLVDSRADDDFTIWLTNRRRTGTDLEERLIRFREKYAHRSFGVCFRADESLSLQINAAETPAE